MKRTSLVSMQTLLLPLLLASCEMGTEVGNGLKPDRSSGGDSDQPKPASSSEVPPAGDEVSAPSSQSEGATNDFAKNDAGPGAGAADQSTTAFDQAILYAKCASPFASALVSPVHLVEGKDGEPRITELKAQYAASTQTWTIDGAGIYGELASDYKCAEGTKTEAVTVDWYADQVLRTRAKLVKNGLTHTLVWYATKPATNGELPELLRVEAAFGPSETAHVLTTAP